MVANIVKAMARRTRAPMLIIMPDSKFMQNWDFVTLFALIFTAIVTPYEVALLETEINGLFFVNRMIDTIFIWDMLMQFFCAYRETPKQGGRMVKSIPRIQCHYLKSWFPIDFMSILPFWVVVFLDPDVAEQMSSLKVVRLIRLLRLAKLVRVLKASKMFKKFESRIAIPFSTLGLLKNLVVLLLMSHWIACLWILADSLERADPLPGEKRQVTWLVKLEADHQNNGSDCAPDDPYYNYVYTSNENYTIEPITGPDGNPCLPDEWKLMHHTFRYTAAMYWAMTTITSVGYGDITPVNKSEMHVVIIALVLSSLLFAYIIGNVCGIITTLDKDNTEHQNLMDELNGFMRDKLIDNEEQASLREYFNNRRIINKTATYKELVVKMSPMLRESVSEKNCEWLFNVPYISSLQADFMDDAARTDMKFVIALESHIDGNVFVPRERIAWQDALFCVARGVCSRKGKVQTKGKFWGEDFVLAKTELKDKSHSMALAYVEVLILSKENFNLVLQLPQFEHIAEKIRVHVLWMAMERGILWAANQKSRALHPFNGPDGAAGEARPQSSGDGFVGTPQFIPGPGDGGAVAPPRAARTGGGGSVDDRMAALEAKLDRVLSILGNQ